MERLQEFKNTSFAESKYIVIEGKSYPIKNEGTGKVAVLAIGCGTLMQKTLSPKFKDLFTVYSSDLYWIKDYKLSNPTEINMDKILEDIFDVINQLKLKQVIILGHSAFGIVALEIAKRNSPQIKAIILIGTPTESNREIASHNNLYFEKNASIERKENDKSRRALYEQIKAPNESEISFNAYEASSARYWGDFNVLHEFLKELWVDTEIDEGLCNHFFGKILPNHYTGENITKIKIPVILLAGRYDYDCLPLVLWKDYPKPSHFKIVDMGEVGHWPNIESSEMFDKKIEDWLKNEVKNSGTK